MTKGARIVLAGEGGQGVQSVANILVEAAYEEGKEALYIPNFGVEQRGGVSVAYVQISEESIGSPKFKFADIIIALSGRAVRRSKKYANEDTLFVYDMAIEDAEKDLPTNAKKVMGIPAINLAKEELHPRVFNVMIMGAVIGMTGVVSIEQAKAALGKKLGYKFEQDPKLKELNFKALEKGIELVKDQV